MTLVIFDCDGVLVDSEPVANAILAAHVSRMGISTTPQQALVRYKGRSMASVLAMIEDELGSALPTDFLDKVQIDTFSAFYSSLKAVVGAEALVQWVQGQGYKTCIASSGDYEKLDMTLGITGLKHYFEGRIFSSMDVENGKPAPDLFLHACKQMGGTPADTYVIEDSQAGVDAAIAAKMKVFAFGDFERTQDITPVSHLSQVIDALKQTESAR